ncbi:MAG: DNA replication/repair protein RecF [bacterium]
MNLRSLALVNFRNYNNAKIEFSVRINLVYGQNAQGKTNFLEAIYLLCLGRSFRGAKNQDLLKHDAQFFTVQGGLIQDNEIEKRVVLRYVKDGKKEISVDRKRIRSHARIFGQFPVVVMAPDEFKITAGGPSERRRFLDVLLSQVSLSYLSDLQEYTRVLKQRNKILHDIRQGFNMSEATIVPWTERLVSIGTRIISFRNHFISDFSKMLNGVYRRFSKDGNRLEVSMESSVFAGDDDSVEQAFLSALERSSGKERVLGMTVVGPHRDDVAFTIDGEDLRKYGSRGEHKSVLFSIKIAEFNYLKEKTQETPILLLDDCYSELDDYREKSIFDTLEGVGQIFLTSPKGESLLESSRWMNSETSTFCVENGDIEHVTA